MYVKNAYVWIVLRFVPFALRLFALNILGNAANVSMPYVLNTKTYAEYVVRYFAPTIPSYAAKYYNNTSYGVGYIDYSTISNTAESKNNIFYLRDNDDKVYDVNKCHIQVPGLRGPSLWLCQGEMRRVWT
jgi:hypothetical protein